MGGGGRTESTNQTTNTNTSGSSAISGDNLGTVLSGVNNSSVNINSTDHGAVKSAGEIAKAALLSNQFAMKEASNLGAKAIDENGKSLGKALDFGKDALNFGEDALKESSKTMREAMAENGAVSRGAMDSVSKNAIYALKENSDVSKKAMDHTMSSLKKNSEINKRAMDSMSKTTLYSLKENGNVNKRAMDNMQKNSANTTAAVKAMAAQSGENARAALAMAENTASRSQIGAAGEMSKVAIAVAIALSLGVAIVAIKGAN